jgi:hypothetical protein
LFASFLSVDAEKDLRMVVSRTNVEVALAPKGLTRALRIDRIPYYILVAPGGRVEWTHLGRLSGTDRDASSRIKEGSRTEVETQ